MSNATLNKIINQNEKDANIMTGMVMAITFSIFTVIYILNVLGIFIIDQTAMAVAYLVSAVLLLSPLIINKIIDPSAKWIKYLYVLLTDLFFVCCNNHAYIPCCTCLCLSYSNSRNVFQQKAYKNFYNSNHYTYDLRTVLRFLFKLAPGL